MPKMNEEPTNEGWLGRMAGESVCGWLEQGGMSALAMNVGPAV